MNILFTGSSSFTGYWFIRKLTMLGHNVFATFQSSLSSYEGIRRERVEKILQLSETCFSCPFGSDSFLSLIDKKTHWDFLCHHGAFVHNYKSDEFPVVKALEKNTFRYSEVLKKLKAKKCKKIVITGSYFEKGEGAGSDGCDSFSPYALSKFLTSETFRFASKKISLPLAKFVISNPFGPYEEERFTSWLIKQWREEKTPEVKTPFYVRDNIPVTLLANAYAKFVLKPLSQEYEKILPSGYIETQKDFALRFAKELEKRLSIHCPLSFINQKEFPEPKIRMNTDQILHDDFDWNEEEAWNELATYYKTKYQIGYEAASV